jgi:hypothetical protein
MKRAALSILAVLPIILAGCDGSDGSDGTTGPAGPPGAPAGQLPTEADGLVGIVRDASGEAIYGGTVYFVPAGDVAALPPTTVEVDSTNDEPLEDLIAANGAGYQQATINANGSYSLTPLTAGSYFITFIPELSDVGHLPGGNVARKALDAAGLLGTQLDLRVSSAAPADAHYVGSGVCVSCHGRSHISETMHRIGIWSNHENGRLQNFGPRFDDLYKAIDTKFDVAGGTTVFFSDFDGARGFDKYRTSETDPGANVAFKVTVSANGDDLEMLLQNVRNPTDPDRVYSVAFIYGGGVNKQRYVTRLTNASGGYHAMLPIQFQHDGSESAVYGRTSKVWRDYHGDFWYDEGTSTFMEPPAKRAFEKNCASCHASSAQVMGSDETTWSLATVEDTFYDSGDFDLDGNGVAEELNVGCESCHGPGSRHWESAGQAKHIVSPSLLTPGREAMICGQCHSRPKGALGSDSPVNADGWMMIAGTSRNEFLTRYATTQLDGNPGNYWTDPDGHSKSHHQQYSDFIRSKMYKNDRELMTCASCHDPHQRTEFTRQLREDPTDNNASCGDGCHDVEAGDLEAHLIANNITIGADFKAGIALCSDCHMTKTAKTGAGHPALDINGTQYWENDITSHLFKVPDRSLATSIQMPVPYTNDCGFCHAALNIDP